MNDTYKKPWVTPKEKEPPSLYAPENAYGYKINISHPSIAPLFERYRQKYKIIGPMSDKQRFHFEGAIMKLIVQGKV